MHNEDRFEGEKECRPEDQLETCNKLSRYETVLGNCGMNGERLSPEKSIINWKRRVREEINEKINLKLLS